MQFFHAFLETKLEAKNPTKKRFAVIYLSVVINCRFSQTDCYKVFIYKAYKPDLCSMTKKQAAHILYLNGLTLKEISSTLQTPYNTITKWSGNSDWKRSKAEKALREQTSQERIWALIDYQLKIIERLAQVRATKLDKITNPETLKKALIERGDIDAR